MRLNAIYRIRCAPDEIDRKAKALAVEQSVEMPLEAIDDGHVLDTIVGRVEAIEEQAPGDYRVTVSLDPETVGGEAGQLMNILFGNSSLHKDITLEDAIFPPSILDAFRGPGSGIDGLRERVGARLRPLTCSALKPQGLPPEKLADLAHRFALGRIDYIKDDHSLADQSCSPYWDRVPACAEAVQKASEDTGHPSRYVPNLFGNLDQLRAQIAIAKDYGLDTVMTAPMVIGLPAFAAITAENRDMAFFAHPSMAGAARIAQPLLLGKLFRLFGADAMILASYGGRFGFSKAVCAAIADAARGELGGYEPALPVPAGGMKVDRLDEIVGFYGRDCMILIGGDLLLARENLTDQSLVFTSRLETLADELP